MNIRYTDSVRQWGEGYTLAQQATTRLADILGPSPGPVTGEWDRAEDDKGCALLTLRLKDSTAEVLGTFAPDELRSSAQTAFRLHRLWGELLHARNVKHLEALTTAED